MKKINRQQQNHAHSDFYIRRIHSLLGIVPIGIFLCFHLLLNSSAIIGVEAWSSVIDGMRSIPFIIVAEIGVIAIPILFHAVYGFYLVYLSDLHPLRYQYYKNWMFVLQRITAIITTLFVVDHVIFVRIMAHTTMDVMQAMAHVLQTPLGFVLELIGVWATVFHFTNGLLTFLITWGVLHGERVQRLASICTMLLCGAMCLWTLIILARIAMMPI
ncbi:MAG: succinate dehydrogenase [Bacillota bacterium]|jgi:succinate dehydrogenase / fumarate reductase cytochrome b subunit